MEPKNLEKLAVLMGLSFKEKSNFPDMLAKGTRVFDGINGQRFLIESSWSDDKIYQELGKALISIGKRQKCMEINKILSITSD